MCALAALLGLAACADRDPIAPHLLLPRADSVRICGAEGEAPCTLEPITGTIDPRKPTDDEEGDDGGGIGTGGGGGGGSGSGGSGGGSTPSDDTPPGDTIPSDTACEATGDTLVDKTQVQDAFAAVWAASNADAASSWDRREAGGWIVKTATGYAFQPFTDMVAEACGMNPLNDAALEPPVNVIAWVHSHPFAFGERAESCAARNQRTGELERRPYRGRPSTNDAVFTDEVNRRLEAGGRPPIDGFIVDKDGIRRFRSLGFEGTYVMYPAIGRCAY